MFDGPLNLPVEQGSARVNAGLGVIPRIVRDGAEIYRIKLKPREAEERLSRLHHRSTPRWATWSSKPRPAWRRRGDRLPLDAIRGECAGYRAGGRYARRRHTRCSAAPSKPSATGFHHRANVPSPAVTPPIYGQPAKGVHALQVEVNRALYLDEERIEPAAASRTCGPASAPRCAIWWARSTCCDPRAGAARRGRWPGGCCPPLARNRSRTRRPSPPDDADVAIAEHIAEEPRHTLPR